MDHSTILIHWLFSWLAASVMALRLGWRYQQMRHFNTGDYLTFAALVCLFVRLAFIHIVLTYGTANMTEEYRATHVLTAAEVSKRVLGSKLAIGNRFFYNTYLWLQKFVLLDLYRRLYLNLPWEKQVYMTYAGVFTLTYVGSQISNITECHPITLYWQVVPDPGSCVQAEVQLLVLGITNIVTDAMLLALPWPLIIAARLPFKRKIQLSSLFILGLFIIAITCIRLPLNAGNITSQVSRTTWASTELLTSAIVVNAPILYALYNKEKAKRSTGTWGSGEDEWSQGPPRISFRQSYFGPGSEASRRWPGMGGIKQTRSVRVEENVVVQSEMREEYSQMTLGTDGTPNSDRSGSNAAFLHDNG